MDGHATTRERWVAIEKKREYLGLRWADIARQADVSELTLRNYRKGRAPSDRILARIERSIGLTTDALEMAEAAQ